ncbi:MAG: nondiscriminating aspartyl-tRNA synthetase [Candidatus Diapherotrites archaeon]|nr:nondiscriminating aspartyl-tRNA synthetase [Candidatus Diapherotrites archaeon]MDN5366790.1 nondiscriminating aspartyl-tRNA synthetase [Candidatus Diapherotrites archaeon]
METIRGWVWNVRDIGKLKFILIRTFPENRIEQVVVKKGNVPDEVLEEAGKYNPETLLEIQGEWVESKKAPNGREFVAKDVKVIANSEPTPIDLTEKTPAEFPTRLEYRYLDLRKPRIAAIFKAKSVIVDAARQVLRKWGFHEAAFFPIIIATATEGGAELFPLVYFDREAFLAQSAQLYKQSLVPALGRVFSIAPSFRAEKSRTRKHLTEFWQIDVEAAFVTKKDLMDIQFDIYKTAAERLNREVPDELKLLGIEEVPVPNKYEKISYDEAIELLRSDGVDIKRGDDFGAPEERQLCSHFDVPFFVTEFPETECAFYYKLREEDPFFAEKMDFLAPGENGLELSSGGPRENDPEKLRKRMIAKGMRPEAFGWYLEMFKYGFPPHGGFGMGVERLTLALLNLDKIMEAMPYPRTPDILTP